MKKNILFFVILCMGVFSGCFDEDNIHADLETYWRDYDTLSNDPVLKYVSEYYYKYGKTFIVDPEPRDYVYNFQSKNTYRLVKPKQDKENLLAGIALVKDLFINGYSDNVIKNIFPFNIIIADSIVWNPYGEKFELVDIASYRNFVVFSVNDKILNYSEKEKEELSTKWNYEFLLKFCIPNGFMNLSQDFYKVSGDQYGTYHDGHLPKEEWYKKGFVWAELMEKSWFYDERTYFPSAESDLEHFFTWLLTTSNDEVMEVVQTYSLVALKYELLIGSLENIGIDYKNMGYKSKE